MCKSFRVSVGSEKSQLGLDVSNSILCWNSSRANSRPKRFIHGCTRKFTDYLQLLLTDTVLLHTTQQTGDACVMCAARCAQGLSNVSQGVAYDMCLFLPVPLHFARRTIQPLQCEQKKQSYWNESFMCRWQMKIHYCF